MQREKQRERRPKPGQVMPQVGVDGLDRVGLTLVVHAPVLAPPTQLAVSVEGVQVVTPGVGSGFYDRLISSGVRASQTVHATTQRDARSTRVTT